MADTRSKGQDSLSEGGILSGCRIIVGVSGGIAAYKTPMLVRRLREAGAEVQAVMTANARQFVTATTLQAVSGRPVRDSLWDAAAEAAMGHIELARWADLIVIAPTTADTLSRLAAGRADDLLSTLRLASRAPVLLAPAMNNVMWDHPATRRNLRRLTEDGCTILGPDSGPQACGETGPGRMQEPEALFAAVRDCCLSIPSWGSLATPVRSTPHLDGLRGKKFLITAGPTREAIDPVRYISNESSGKQGYALASAALRVGGEVTLISGPVNIAPPVGAKTISVTTAQQMNDAVQAQLPATDIFIGVAAVADYRPAEKKDQKIKKLPGGEKGLRLLLVENPDIIAGVSSSQNRPFVVGFAAETQDALRNAREKRKRKGMDMIVVNDVANPDIGFNSEENAVAVIWHGGEEKLPQSSKAQLAEWIIDRIATCYVDQLAPANPESVAE